MDSLECQGSETICVLYGVEAILFELLEALSRPGLKYKCGPPADTTKSDLELRLTCTITFFIQTFRILTDCFFRVAAIFLSHDSMRTRLMQIWHGEVFEFHLTRLIPNLYRDEDPMECAWLKQMRKRS